MKNRAAVVATVAIATAAAVSCARDVTVATKADTTTVDCTLQGATVSPPSATLHVGDTLRFRATVVFCSPPHVGGVTWKLNDTSVARLVATDTLTALVRAQRAGSVTLISASLGNPAVQGAAALVVTP